MLATGPCVDAAVTAVSPTDCHPGNLRSGSIFVSAVRENAWEPLKLGLISGYYPDKNRYNNLKRNIWKLPSLKD